MATMLLLLVWLVLLPHSCLADIRLKNDSGGLSLSTGTKLVNKLTTVNKDIGTDLSGVQNVTAIFLSRDDTDKLCHWLESDDVDRGQLLGQNWTGIDMIVSLWQEERCHWNFLEKACTVVPILVDIDPGMFPGLLSTHGLGWTSERQALVASCSILQGRLLQEDLYELETSVLFRAEVSMDAAEAYELFRSFPIQFLFRGIVPVLYFMVSAVSARIYIERRRIHGKVGWYHAFVLGMNIGQGTVFGVLNVVGLHGLTDTFHIDFVVVTFANFLSLSVATDLVFSRLLHDVCQGFRMRRRQYRSINNGKWVGVAVGIISVEFVPTLAYAVNPTASNWRIIATVLPSALTFFSFLVTGYLVYQMRLIASALIDAFDTSQDQETQPRSKAQLVLARRYYFWTKLSIVSILMAYCGAVLVLLRLQQSSHIVFLIVVFMLDFAKVLNMLAQSICCRTPSSGQQGTSVGTSNMKNLKNLEAADATSGSMTKSTSIIPMQ